jgi:hypothetical protein
VRAADLNRSGAGAGYGEAVTDDVSTVYLGRYSRETANLVAAELEERHIVWWYKEPGIMASLWEFGVRMFVDREHFAEAMEIADRISAEREAKGWPPLE